MTRARAPSTPSQARYPTRARRACVSPFRRREKLRKIKKSKNRKKNGHKIFSSLFPLVATKFFGMLQYARAMEVAASGFSLIFLSPGVLHIVTPHHMCSTANARDGVAGARVCPDGEAAEKGFGNERRRWRC